MGATQCDPARSTPRVQQGLQRNRYLVAHHGPAFSRPASSSPIVVDDATRARIPHNPGEAILFDVATQTLGAHTPSQLPKGSRQVALTNRAREQTPTQADPGLRNVLRALHPLTH